MRMLGIARLGLVITTTLLLSASGFASGYTYSSTDCLVPGNGVGTVSGGGSTYLVIEPGAKLFGVRVQVGGTGTADISGTISIRFVWSGTGADDPSQDATLMPRPAGRATGSAFRGADVEGTTGSAWATSSGSDVTGSALSDNYFEEEPKTYLVNNPESADDPEQGKMIVYVENGQVRGRWERHVSAHGEVEDPFSPFYNGTANARGLTRRRDSVVEN